MESEQLQRAIEAILFAAGERIDIGRLAAALETDASDVEKAADDLADKYAFERRGIRILKLEKGYQMVSSGEMADYVTKALETRKPPKLSSSQLETLTIILTTSRRRRPWWSRSAAWTVPIPWRRCSVRSSSRRRGV